MFAASAAARPRTEPHCPKNLVERPVVGRLSYHAKTPWREDEGSGKPQAKGGVAVGGGAQRRIVVVVEQGPRGPD